MSVVIVGGGQAGFQAAVSLRENGYSGSLTVVGDEKGLPYQRPPLSKAFLTDDDPGPLDFRPAEFFERHQITTMDARVVSVDRQAKTVATDSGMSLDYRYLVFATGARPRSLPFDGIDQSRIVTLRDHDEARSIRRSLLGGDRLLIIGAGFIGLEVAAAARKLGCAATVVESAPRVLARAASVPLSQYVADLHQSHGTELRLTTTISQAVQRGRVIEATCSDGSVIEVDRIVVGIGVVPCADLAVDAGLEVNDGIVVDETLRTSDESVFAIGDCARFPHPAAGGSTRLESVQNAVDQARHVAAEIVTGEFTTYAALPWFWTRQFDANIQIAGVAYAQDSCHVKATDDPPADSGAAFSVLRFRDDLLVAVESVNKPRDHLRARKLLAGSETISVALAMEDDFDLAPARATAR